MPVSRPRRSFCCGLPTAGSENTTTRCLTLAGGATNTQRVPAATKHFFVNHTAAKQSFSFRLCHDCLRGLLFAILLGATLAGTGCTSLKPVADFGLNASGLVGDPAVAKDYPLSLTRQQLYGQPGASVSPAQIAQRQHDARRFLEAQQVLQAYGQALGALAADDLSAYDTEVAALNKNLVAGKFATTSQTAAYAAALKIGFRWGTSLYRAAKIKQLILTYNPSVQAATTQLAVVVDSYLTGLAGEQGMFTQLVAGRARHSAVDQGIAGLPQLITVLADEYEQGLATKAANARSLIAGLKTFAQGHQELAVTLHQGTWKSTLAVARQYAAELRQIIQSLTP